MLFRRRVLTLVPFFFVFFVWLPAWVVLGYWFVVQFLNGAATSIASTHERQRSGVLGACGRIRRRTGADPNCSLPDHGGVGMGYRDYSRSE